MVSRRDEKKKKKERERERDVRFLALMMEKEDHQPKNVGCRQGNRFFPRVNGRKYSPTKNSRIRPMLDLWNHRKQICVKFKSL